MSGLLRILGVGFGLAVIIGTTVGSGILRTPGEVAAHLPDAGWIIAAWIAGGLYALLGGISLAELGTMLPRAGGQYVFAQRAFGRYAGFLAGWSDWLGSCGAAAAVAIVIGEYVRALLPPGAPGPGAFAVPVVLLFASLQWRGVEEASRVQQITSLLKMAALLGLVGACFLITPAAEPVAARAALPLPEGAALLTACVLAMQAVIYTYDGYHGVLYFSEEVRDPGRNLPRSMFGGIALVILVYVLMNAGFLQLLGVDALAGEEFAAGAAALALFGEAGDRIIRAIAIVVLLSAVNANLLCGSRTIFGLGRDRLMPPLTVQVSARGTPRAALLATTVVALLFAATGAFAPVLALMAFFFVANYTLSFAALFVLRRREPNLPRPYRAWGYPWTTGAALAGSLAFLIGAIAGDTRQSVLALGLLAASVPLFFLLVRPASDE